MTKQSEPVHAMSPSSDDDLLRRTLRTMALLVGACVVFVGVMSLAAVLVTSRAVGQGASTSAVEAKPAPDANAAKKPLSI